MEHKLANFASAAHRLRSPRSQIDTRLRRAHLTTTTCHLTRFLPQASSHPRASRQSTSWSGTMTGFGSARTIATHQGSPRFATSQQAVKAHGPQMASIPMPISVMTRRTSCGHAALDFILDVFSPERSKVAARGAAAAAAAAAALVLGDRCRCSTEAE